MPLCLVLSARRNDRGEGTHFANSIREAVTLGTQSFFTRSMFLGGPGHCKQSRSLFRVSVTVSPSSMDSAFSNYLDTWGVSDRAELRCL